MADSTFCMYSSLLLLMFQNQMDSAGPDSSFIQGGNNEEARVVLNVRPSNKNLVVEVDQEYVKSCSCLLHTVQLV